MNVLDHFDALHPGPSWKPWRSLVAAGYGEPMDDTELAHFRAHTGRQEPREGGYAEVVVVVGVQSGKSSVAAALAGHAALTGGRGEHALMVAQDHRSSMRALLRYAREPFETIPAFQAEVERSTADTIELRRGTSLSAYPCRPAGVRGIRACIVCIDELAFFQATDGRPVDEEMLRVARGRVANTGGKVIVLSSPWGMSGALWDLNRRHHGREDSSTLVWQASAPEMNPELPADYLARMREADPAAYRAEVEGQFIAGVSSFLDPEALDDVTDTGVRERRYGSGTRYSAHFDASGGRRDAAALGIAHRDGKRAVLDLIRAWPSPHRPAAVIAEAARILRAYGISRVTVDRYAGEFPIGEFRRHDIRADVAKLTTSETYSELLPLVNSRSVLLLDEPTLLRELRGLERHATRSGRDRIDHRRGAHDDRAAAAAGALVLALSRPAKGTRITWGTRAQRLGGWIAPNPEDVVIRETPTVPGRSRDLTDLIQRGRGGWPHY